MKHTTRSLVLAAAVAAFAGTCAVIAVTQGSPIPAAHAAEADGATPTAPARRAQARAAYEGSLARHRNPLAYAVPPVDEHAKAAESCPKGMVFWRRGLDVELCVDECASDDECLPNERCRVIARDMNPGPPYRFADEQPIDDEETAIALCDPFSDEEAAVTAAGPAPAPDSEADFGVAPDESAEP